MYTPQKRRGKNICLYQSRYWDVIQESRRVIPTVPLNRGAIVTKLSFTGVSFTGRNFIVFFFFFLSLSLHLIRFENAFPPVIDRYTRRFFPSIFQLNRLSSLSTGTLPIPGRKKILKAKYSGGGGKKKLLVDLLEIREAFSLIKTQDVSNQKSRKIESEETDRFSCDYVGVCKRWGDIYYRSRPDIVFYLYWQG